MIGLLVDIFIIVVIVVFIPMAIGIIVKGKKADKIKKDMPKKWYEKEDGEE